MADPTPLNRNQIAAFVGNDPDAIRAIERLFKVAGQLTPDEIAALTQLILDNSYATGSADNKAEVALASATAAERLADLIAKGPVPEANNSLRTDYLDLNLAAPHVSRIGRLAWNDADQTADLGMEYGVVQQIGLEYYARVENMTGVMIPNGTVVGFAGVGANNVISVTPYLADGSQSSLYILGVLTHDLPDSGEVGYCTVWGHVRGMDTSAFSVGDILYASPTVAGGLTATKPTAPDNVIPVAAVLASDAVNGEIFVRPTIEQQEYYGQFSKTTTVSPAATNTAYAVTWDNADISNGISIVSGTQLTVVDSGHCIAPSTYEAFSCKRQASSISRAPPPGAKTGFTTTFLATPRASYKFLSISFKTSLLAPLRIIEQALGSLHSVKKVKYSSPILLT